MSTARQLDLLEYRQHIPVKKRVRHKKESPKNPQREKRIVQAKLNSRLADHIFRDPRLVGGVVALAGTKVAEATGPYMRQKIAKYVLIAEHNKSAHANIMDIMKAFPEDFRSVRLYNKPIDVFKLAIKAIKAYPGELKGFDLDFDGTLNAKKKGQLVELIDTIDADAWWLRIGITIRPYPAHHAERILGDVLTYIDSRGLFDIREWRISSYCDSAPMRVAQIICTRR